MKLEIHYDQGEWAALYQDGELVRVGDSYVSEQKALELLGVTIVQDDAFMRGQDQADGVAKTLNEVDEYRRARDNAKALAAEKRAEADRLRAEADKLDPR